MAPESDSSPKYTRLGGKGVFVNDDTSAAATARSAAGSVIFMPPATLR